MNAWYLIFCKPRQDSRAELNLTRQGYEVYRPLIHAGSRTKAGSGSQMESLFPGYIFIKAGGETSLRPVSSTLGVSRFVRFGSKYATAPAALIDQIKAQERALSAPPAGESKCFVKGNPVMLKMAGFEGVKAIYASPCGQKRSIILMNILGAQSKLFVPTERLSVHG